MARLRTHCAASHSPPHAPHIHAAAREPLVVGRRFVSRFSQATVLCGQGPRKFVIVWFRPGVVA